MAVQVYPVPVISLHAGRQGSEREDNIMIRKLEEKDRQLYIEMAREFYHSDAVLHPVPDSHFAKTAAESLNGSRCAEIYILEYDSAPAGYALTARSFSQEAGGFVVWIEEIYIREPYRSKGLGREFFNYIEKEKDGDLGREFFNYIEKEKDGDTVRIRLEVEEKNERAQSLYRQLGYEVLDYVQMIKDF